MYWRSSDRKVGVYPGPAATLVATAAVLALFGTICFACRRPEYRQTIDTISELGERGAGDSRLVSFGLFLPVGLLVWLALWLVHRQNPGVDVSLSLLALSCLGTGYVVAAFFPCDPGSPLYGSWRQQVHNLPALFSTREPALGSWPSPAIWPGETNRCALFSSDWPV